MIIKPRIESKELRILRILDRRMNLTHKVKQHYLNLEKGFEGEQKFDEFLAKVSRELLILNDLTLEKNNTTFQIDTLLFSQQTIYLFEVKNYEGDYYIEGEKWFSSTENEIKNPLLQLKRSESLFRRSLQDLGHHFTVESYLVFMNPEFSLLQAPRNLPTILPSQLNRFLKKLDAITRAPQERHRNCASQLLSSHLEETPYSRLPSYNYEQLKKGFICGSCQSFNVSYQKNVLICDECGHKETIESVILRSAEEYSLLFPERKITTKAIHDWCGLFKTKKPVLRTLLSNYKVMGCGKSSYFLPS